MVDSIEWDGKRWAWPAGRSERINLLESADWDRVKESLNQLPPDVRAVIAATCVEFAFEGCTATFNEALEGLARSVGTV